MTKPVIINYTDARMLFDNKHFCYEGLIIPATSSMADAYTRQSVASQQPVIAINSLISHLMRVWKSPSLRLEQLLLLGNILDRMEEKYPGDKQIAAMQKDKTAVLKSLIALVEIGLDAESLPDAPLCPKHFKEAYHAFVSDDDSWAKKAQAEWQSWLETGIFSGKLEAALRSAKPEAAAPFSSIHAVYLQGFYYITPIQARVIESILHLGVPVYFLNNYDASMPDSYAVWEGNPRFRSLDMYAFRQDGENAHCPNLFSPERVQNGLAAGQKRKPRFLKFRDNFSLIRWLTDKIPAKDSPGAGLYSPQSDDLKDLVKSFFPEHDKRQHLLSYPVGQYLLYLYRMWDGAEQKLIFKPELIRQALATGWAGDSYAEGRDVLFIFDRLTLYFENCRTQDEWRNSANALIEVQRKLSSLAEEPDLGRWKDVVRQPLKTYAPFSCSSSDVKQIVSIIENMENDAKLLFGKDKHVKLEQHFRNLEALLKRKATGEVIFEEEQRVIAGLLQKLEKRPKRIKTCAARQLSEAMQIFLGGGLDDLVTDGDEDAWPDGPVRGLSDIEAAPFLHEGQEIILCCCDEKHLPGRPKPYPWPLSLNFLAGCKNLPEEAAKRRDDYLYYMESTRLSDRYLFTIASHNPNLTLSWIEVQQGKPLVPSVYLEILRNQTNAEVEPWTDNLLVEGNASRETLPSFSVPGLTTEMFPGGMPPAEVFWNQDWCPQKYSDDPYGYWRNLYDFVLAPHPIISSDFLRSFYLTSLIACMAQTKNISINAAAKRAFRYIPVLDAVERAEITDFASRIRPRIPANALDGFLFNNKQYKMLRLYLKYLPLAKSSLYADKKSSTPDFSFSGFPKDANKKHQTAKNLCIFCPHKTYCMGRADDGEDEEEN